MNRRFFSSSSFFSDNGWVIEPMSTLFESQLPHVHPSPTKFSIRGNEASWYIYSIQRLVWPVSVTPIVARGQMQAIFLFSTIRSHDLNFHRSFSTTSHPNRQMPQVHLHLSSCLLLKPQPTSLRPTCKMKHHQQCRFIDHWTQLCTKRNVSTT